MLRVWANQIQVQMDQQMPAVERIVIFAGQRYREFLMDYLKRRCFTIDVPMDKLRIGEQLRWLLLRADQPLGYRGTTVSTRPFAAAPWPGEKRCPFGLQVCRIVYLPC
jgi:hypothetical protein